MSKRGVKKGRGGLIAAIVVVGILLVGIILAVRAIFIEPFMLKTTVKSYSLKGLKEPFTAAFFTDTHFGKFYSEGNLGTIAEAINNHSPQVIFFGGDLMDSYYRDKPNLEAISKGLEAMAAPEGKFAVWGNHDVGGGGQRVYEATLNAGGFRLLKNETVYLEKLGVWLGGLDVGIFGSPEPEIVERFQGGQPGILLAHEPGRVNELPQSAENTVDMMFSGHNHGGQVGLPFVRYMVVQEKDRAFLKGDFTVNGTRLFVSSGIGTTKLPMRLFNTPEVVIIHFVPAESGG